MEINGLDGERWDKLNSDRVREAREARMTRASRMSDYRVKLIMKIESRRGLRGLFLSKALLFSRVRKVKEESKGHILEGYTIFSFLSFPLKIFINQSKRYYSITTIHMKFELLNPHNPPKF